jgi:hypothetical protein
MKIYGFFLPTGKTVVFSGLEEASRTTRIQEGYIMRCIETGRKWKGWTFRL